MTIPAKSLSEVVAVADNPPSELSPTTTTTRKSQDSPLVLYIARIPGSKGRFGLVFFFFLDRDRDRGPRVGKEEKKRGREKRTGADARVDVVDVFLTTMKPLQKVVTAEDVRRCLYYVHFDCEGEGGGGGGGGVCECELGRAGKGNRGAECRRKPVPASEMNQNENGCVVNPSGSEFRRKPVPTTGEKGFDKVDRQPHFELPNHPHDAAARIRQMPAAAAQDAHVNLLIPPQSLQPSIPHPFGPRSMRQRHPPPGETTTTLEMNAAGPSNSNPPTLPPRLPLSVKQKSDDGDGPRSRPTRNREIELSQQRAGGGSSPCHIDNHMRNSRTSVDMSLTLIRRHDGSQWNVGKIFRTREATTTRHLNGGTKSNDKSAAADNQTPSGGGLYIDILTPGYDKFTTQEPSLSSSSFLSEGRPQVDGKGLSSQQIHSLESSPAHERTWFRRQIKTATVEKRGKRRRHSGSGSSLFDRRGLRSSIDLKKRTGQDERTATASNHTRRTSSSSSSSSYTFQSPWNSTCEFTFGLTNRSLRCKHHLSPHPHPISELRFNLPASNSNPSPHHHQTSNRPSFLLPPRHHHHRTPTQPTTPSPHQPNDDDEDDSARMDLSLGQERAGGGPGGKEAKLGKLIVENHGLDMLDLLVAANVAVWWGVYDPR